MFLFVDLWINRPRCRIEPFFCSGNHFSWIYNFSSDSLRIFGSPSDHLTFGSSFSLHLTFSHLEGSIAAHLTFLWLVSRARWLFLSPPSTQTSAVAPPTPPTTRSTSSSWSIVSSNPASSDLELFVIFRIFLQTWNLDLVSMPISNHFWCKGSHFQKGRPHI